jgi:hypothetical protein
LSSALPRTGEFGQRVEQLAREISGETSDLPLKERAFAVAELTLLREKVRSTKAEMIKRVFGQGSVDKPPRVFSEIREVDGCIEVTLLPGARISNKLRLYPSLPVNEPDRTAQAISRALDEWVRLNRYERRAASAFDRAVRGLDPWLGPGKPDSIDPGAEPANGKKNRDRR